MEQLNEKLTRLIDRMARRHRLKAMMDDLQQRRAVLMGDVQALKEQTYREELDVERLEGFSLARLFYRLTGQLQERLEKEEAEACAIALKYDAKRRELRELEDDLSAREQEWCALTGCEREYEALLAEKARRLKELNSFYADKICALEERMAYLGAREKELTEALRAADHALDAAGAVQRSLSSAEGWSTFDLVGGGIIGDMAKHSHLDEAQRQINALQHALSRLHTELADVSIHADLQIQVDGFLRFADYFFDGLFADWAVRDRIQSSRQQVERVTGSIHALRRQLDRDLCSGREARESCKRELDELVLRA